MVLQYIHNVLRILCIVVTVIRLETVAPMVLQYRRRFENYVYRCHFNKIKTIARMSLQYRQHVQNPVDRCQFDQIETIAQTVLGTDLTPQNHNMQTCDPVSP
jgi:hypothetical protein